MANLIEVFSISSFRSFYGEPTIIGPLSKVNLFAGANNSGKSNILRYLTKFYGPMLATLAEGKYPKLPYRDLDFPPDTKRELGIYLLPVKFEKAIIQRVANVWSSRHHQNPAIAQKVIEHLQTIPGLTTVGNSKLFPVMRNVPNERKLGLAFEKFAITGHFEPLRQSNHLRIVGELLGVTTGQPTDHLNAVVLAFFNASHENIAAPLLVPAFRKIESLNPQFAEDEQQVKQTSDPIISGLHALESPTLDNAAHRKRFHEINEFLKTVLQNKSAQLRVPHDQKAILVEIDGYERPLEAVGTGIHQLIYLAAQATIETDRIICIEEPELFLHPTLQRQLIRYLNDHTSNQYFITTHSAALLDAKDASIFHVQMIKGHSQVQFVTSDISKFAICTDLGYRASDLVQTNFVVWVEGPSDRIYVRRWIELCDETLIEGIHYSLMFYGGALLSHLSTDESAVRDFIHLRRLNRNWCVIMDSDKGHARDKISLAKNRIVDEFAKSPDGGFAWVTQGREIENYLPRETIEKVWANRLSRNAISNYNKFTDLFVSQGSKKYRWDKVAIAQAATSLIDSTKILDLDRQIRFLCNRIRTANGLIGGAV